MKIAVLSGKGGTGKTLISVNMAAALKSSNYIDCDVEEPNGHLFFKPKNIENKVITVKIPLVDRELCNGCRNCVDFCKYNALAYINNKIIIFEDVCHSCGGCVLLCPKKALIEMDKPIGLIKKGKSENVNVISGILNMGEASGVPIIKEILDYNLDNESFSIIDCPPGSACSVIESIKDVDYCMLVAEPTIFGVHNLNMVYELVKLFNKPIGVVINKSFEGNDLVEEFCAKNNISILCKIPFDNELGLLNSNAIIAVREKEKYKELFKELIQNVEKEIKNEAIINS